MSRSPACLETLADTRPIIKDVRGLKVDAGKLPRLVVGEAHGDTFPVRLLDNANHAPGLVMIDSP